MTQVALSVELSLNFMVALQKLVYLIVYCIIWQPYVCLELDVETFECISIKFDLLVTRHENSRIHHITCFV